MRISDWSSDVCSSDLREHRLHKAHFITTLVALVLGGLTIYVHDARFIKFKPTVVYAVFSLALLGRHLIGDRVLLARLAQKSIQLTDTIWRKVNFAWAHFFGGYAVMKNGKASRRERV